MYGVVNEVRVYDIFAYHQLLCLELYLFLLVHKPNSYSY